MKIFLLIMLFLFGHFDHSDFDRYIQSLKIIDLPITLNRNVDLTKFSNVDSSTFSSFKYFQSKGPVGVILHTDSYIATIEYSVGSLGLYYTLMTYTIAGQKVDSLNLLSVTRYANEIVNSFSVTINDDHSLIISDSIRRWINDEQFEPINSTISINLTSNSYEINPSGKIINNRG